MMAENLGIEPSGPKAPAFQASVAPCNTFSEMVEEEGVAPPSPEGCRVTAGYGLLTSRNSSMNGADEEIRTPIGLSPAVFETDAYPVGYIRVSLVQRQ